MCPAVLLPAVVSSRLDVSGPCKNPNATPSHAETNTNYKQFFWRKLCNIWRQGSDCGKRRELVCPETLRGLPYDPWTSLMVFRGEKECGPERRKAGLVAVHSYTDTVHPLWKQLLTLTPDQLTPVELWWVTILNAADTDLMTGEPCGHTASSQCSDYC